MALPSTAHPDTTGRILAVAAVAILLAFGWLALLQTDAPAAAGASTATSDFSSARALEHLRVIASEPHPVGSPAHAAVRDYLAKSLTDLGLEVEVQRATALTRNRIAVVNNVVGRLHGAEPGRSVLLVAHYDSVPGSYGAADDGAAVASLLETVRALKTGAQLKNDVVVLFSDAEEVGLLGARAFVAEHPWAREVGVALNFDARGTGGPVLMFETSEGNGRLVDVLARATRRPVTSSLLYDVYKMLPNDTDFSVFRKAGIPGMNFAFVGELTHYHSSRDDLANLDESSVQHTGVYALDLARALGNADLGTLAATNSVYFTLPGSIVVRYPASLALPIALAIAAIFVAVVVLGLLRKRLSVGGLALGLGGLALALVTAAGSTVLAGMVVGAIDNERRWTPWGVSYGSEYFFGAFFALALGAVWALWILYRRRVRAESLLLGGMLLVLVALLATSLLSPGVSYLFAWPLLFGLLGVGATFMVDERALTPARTCAAAALFATPALVLYAPVCKLMMIGLPLAAAPVSVVLLAFALWLVLPASSALGARARWLVPALCAISFVAFVAVGELGSSFDKERPSADSLFYALDADAGTAVWASTDDRPDEWTSRYFGDSAKRDLAPTLFPGSPDDLLNAPAPAVSLTPPGVTLVDDHTEGDVRTMRLRVASTRSAPALYVYVDPSSEVVGAAVDGKPLDDSALRRRGPDAWWSVLCWGVPVEGIELTLALKGNAPVGVRVIDEGYGLPDVPGAPAGERPDHVIARPTGSGISDVTMVTRLVKF